MNSNNSTIAKELGYILFSDKLPKDKQRINYWHDGEKEGTFDAVDNIVVEYGRLPKMWKPIKEESHVDNSKEGGRSELTNAAVAHSKHSLGVVLLQQENTSLKERIKVLEGEEEMLRNENARLLNDSTVYYHHLQEMIDLCNGLILDSKYLDLLPDEKVTLEKAKEAINQK